MLKFQRDLCRALESEEGGKKFQVDKWTRKKVHNIVKLFVFLMALCLILYGLGKIS